MEGYVNQILFALLRSAICGTKLTDEDRALYTPEQLPEMLKLSRLHDVTHLLAVGLRNNGLCSSETAEIEKDILKAVFRYERLNRDFEGICQTFESAGVPFMPLKGSVIRALYPEPWMRTSCDLDILVHKEELEQAIAVLKKELGYQYYQEGSHDVTLLTPCGNHLELHFDLIEKEHGTQFAEQLKDVWTAAKTRDGYQYWYEMSDGMFYFYHVAHMAKHVESGGCGIRPFIDHWILGRMTDADMENRKKLLEQGGLLKFCETATAISEKWFEGIQVDAITTDIENFVISGGVYGTRDNHVLVRSAKGGNRVKNFFNMLFLSKETLQWSYPKLKKVPILYPYYTVKRWLRVFDRKERESLKYLTGMRNANTSAEVASTEKMLQSIGLKEM